MLNKIFTNKVEMQKFKEKSIQSSRQYLNNISVPFDEDIIIQTIMEIKSV